MKSKSLEQIINTYIALPNNPSAKGWYHVLCKVCNDHGRKGKRGGFKFEGNTVAYNCFNCGHSATYNPDVHETVSQKMQEVLKAFCVPEDEIQQLQFTSLTNWNHKTRKTKKQENLDIEPSEISYPKTFYFLKDALPEDKWAIIATSYLLERGIDHLSYPFMLSSKTDDPKLKKWFGRIIIPIYKNGHVIYFQGRDLVGNKTRKYESPPFPKDKVLYGFDRLFEQTDAPLYIVEGWFDAFSIDGVAIFGNKITHEQAIWLNRSPRKKVYIPDRFGDGQIAAHQALNYGWYISTPDIGSNCKDMNDAVNKYGKLYVMKTLADNTTTGFFAETNLGLFCEQSTREKKNKKAS